MKINYLSEAVKILLFAASIIVVCVLCSIGFKTSKDWKSSAAAASEQLNTMESEYSNVDLSVYDGNTILGSELINLIKNTIEKKDYLSIVVWTLAGSRTDYNYVFDDTAKRLFNDGTTRIETSKAQSAYINQGAQFQGTAVKDENNNIICLYFEQME